MNIVTENGQQPWNTQTGQATTENVYENSNEINNFSVSNELVKH